MTCFHDKTLAFASFRVTKTSYSRKGLDRLTRALCQLTVTQFVDVKFALKWNRVICPANMFVKNKCKWRLWFSPRQLLTKAVKQESDTITKVTKFFIKHPKICSDFWGRLDHCSRYFSCYGSLRINFLHYTSLELARAVGKVLWAYMLHHTSPELAKAVGNVLGVY